MLLEDEKKREQLSRMEEKERMRAKIEKVQIFCNKQKEKKREVLGEEIIEMFLLVKNMMKIVEK